VAAYLLGRCLRRISSPEFDVPSEELEDSPLKKHCTEVSAGALLLNTKLDEAIFMAGPKLERLEETGIMVCCKFGLGVWKRAEEGSNMDSPTGACIKLRVPSPETFKFIDDELELCRLNPGDE
jgi:hypothetical protein